MPELIIFDFDGVIIDSEIISNRILAEELTALGMTTTLEDALSTYMGHRWADCVALMAERWGKMPDDLVQRIGSRYRLCIETELKPITGVEDFLKGIAGTPRCIASSSAPDAIRHGLSLTGLGGYFGEHVYSGAFHVKRGKPFPDIYLFAAEAMGSRADRAVVIEDSPTGVKAAHAAGAMVIGLCAGSHTHPGHVAQLKDAGADRIAHSYAQVRQIIASL
jgi:HAD superfamily hydrolase (TIGR01509 family)